MVQVHLNPGGQAELAGRYSRAIQDAQKTHAGQQPTHVPLHLMGKDSPVVRMKMHEPLLVPVCCNCLGPATVRVPIPMSPGPIGFLFDRLVRLMIPLCAACHARTKTSLLEIQAVVGLGLIVTGIILVVVWMGVVLAAIGVVSVLVGLQTVRLHLRRPTTDKLVRVVRTNSGQGWMDVRFGNSDYARLVDDLNAWNSGR